MSIKVVGAAPSVPTDAVRKAELDLKAPLASPTFTGTVSGITKAMVGLGNVDNTADTAKPVSTLQAAADAAATAAAQATSVQLTGTQTVAGAKTFSTTPVVGTAAVGTNTTAAASTAFVVAEILSRRVGLSLVVWSGSAWVDWVTGGAYSTDPTVIRFYISTNDDTGVTSPTYYSPYDLWFPAP